MPDAFTFYPIGVIRTPYRDREGMPIQSARSAVTGTVEVDPQYAAGLVDIETFSHLILIYVFDRSPGPKLTVRPFLDDAEHGVFATRHPDRPNPIGLSVVELERREGNVLHVRGVDMLDRTRFWTSSPTCRSLTTTRPREPAGWPGRSSHAPGAPGLMADPGTFPPLPSLVFRGCAAAGSARASAARSL